jgi:hypothetical protein
VVERQQGAQRVVDHFAELALRRLDADAGDDGLLAGGGILAGGFAERFGRSGDVEDVVGELEGPPGRFGISGSDAPGRSAEAPPMMAPMRTAARIRAPVFIACNCATARSVRKLVSPSMSRICPPTMPPAPAPAASSATRRTRIGRIGVGGVVGQRDGERVGQQRVAGEDGGRVVVGLVHGGLAATQVVVVHGRQVVVDQ